MAKTKSSKNRKKNSVSKANPRSYAELIGRDDSIPQQPVRETKTEKAKPGAASPAAASTVTADLSGEYSQIYADLRQLIIISVVLFVIMVALGYFI